MTGVKAISCRLSPQYSSTAKRASTYCQDRECEGRIRINELCVNILRETRTHLHVVEVILVNKLEKLLRYS